MTGNLPDSPTGDLEFGIYSSEGGYDDFLPYYYPARFTVTTEKDLEKVAAADEGQRISINELKNSTLHVTGKIHSHDIDALHDIAHTTESVEVITPVLKTGAMDAYVKSVEQGELIGYDAWPENEDWMFEYTIDLVSTGENEYNRSKSSAYISNKITD